MYYNYRGLSRDRERDLRRLDDEDGELRRLPESPRDLEPRL